MARMTGVYLIAFMVVGLGMAQDDVGANIAQTSLLVADASYTPFGPALGRGGEQQQEQLVTAPVEPTIAAAVLANFTETNSNNDATDPDKQGSLDVANQVVLPAGLVSRMGRVGVLSLSATESAGLSQHNYWRAKHNTPALAWDSNLASKASSWAYKCNYKYDPSLTSSSTGDNYWAGTSTSTSNAIVAAVDSWYYQEAMYPYTADASKVRQFAQVVWKAATKVGCAVKTCNSIYYYVVCRYNKRAADYLNGNNANILPRDTLEAALTLPVIYTVLKPEGTVPSAGTQVPLQRCALKSLDWRFRLCIFAEGMAELQYVAFEAAVSYKTLWQSPIIGGPGQVIVVYSPVRLALQSTDGNLVAYDNRNTPLWATNTFSNTVSRAVVTNTGDFVVYNTANAVVWHTGTKYP